MTIGTIVKNHFTTAKDPYTGATITRLTDPQQLHHHMYFYNRMLTADGKKLLYASTTNAGRQLFLMTLGTGAAVQITDGPDLDDFSGVIAADDQGVYYQQAGSVWYVSLSTLTRKLVFQPEDGWNAGNWGMSDDNRYMAIVATKKDTLPPRKKGAGWNFFAETCLAKPLCRLIYVDTLTGESKIILEDRCWFGHAQIRPGDPQTIMFCHEGPYDLIDARIWLIQSDGTNYRCCREQPTDLILTHEFWLPDGSKLAYVYRETTGEKIENIRLMDPVTMEEEILMACSPFAHFIAAHHAPLMVGDSQSGDVPIHLLGQQKKKVSHEVPNDFIYLVNMEKRQERRLCYHGTSWGAQHGNPQDSHPHPCFTPDDKSVIFVSDREGLPAIYRVNI